MNRKKSLASIIMALILCFSLCTTAFADNEDDAPVYDDTPVYSEEEEPVYSEEEEPVYSEEEEPVYSEEEDPVYSEEDIPSYSKEEEPAYSDDYTPSYNNYSDDTDYYGGDSSDDSESYVYYDDNDDGSDFDENSEQYSDTKAPTSPVYDVKNKKISTDTLKKSDWEKIKAQLKNADSSGDDDNFNFIKKNSGSDDNGIWLLYLGIALEVIGAGIIIGVIIYIVRKKKKLKNNGNGKSNRGGKGGGKQEPAPEHIEETPAPDRDPKKAKKRSKYDTDEIVLPKRAAQKNNGGGRRYKPKH